MDKIVELLSILSLTLFGFLIPVISIFMSLYNEGFKMLSIRYNESKRQAEENIKSQISKIQGDNVQNLKNIKNSIRQLESINRESSRKINLLKPSHQIITILLASILSFCLFSSYFLIKDIQFKGISISLFPPFLGIFCLCYLMYYVISILLIAVEASEEISNNKSEYENKVIQLLSTLIEKQQNNSHIFLKKVYLILENEIIDSDSKNITLKLDTKSNLKVDFRNSENKMAKDVEVGMIFPSKFLIDKSIGHSLYTTSDTNIIRYKIGRVQGNTQQLFTDLTITPLEKGEFTITTFIKGENIESKYSKVKFTIK